jgi:SAM-dependent methyltransferase
MRPWIFALSMILLFPALAMPAGAAEISRYSITFDVQPSGDVRETIHVAFGQETGEAYFTYVFSGDISGLSVTDGLGEIQHSVEGTGADNVVRILAPAGTREIYIYFSSRDLVFWNGNVMQFFTDFHPPEGLSRAEITVMLPQGYSVYRDMASPEPVKSTDGERIFLKWSLEDPGENPISVKIYNPNQSSDSIIIPALSAAFLAGLFWLFFRSRKTARHAFMKGFTEDERRVVEALRQRKHAYQNRLEKELGFSKAKMTRITQRLEGKGLIEREKTGRTKRIEWKG